VQILSAFLLVYLIVLAARAVLSWFPSEPGSALSSINQLLYTLTEPVLAPVRRIIPPVGMFDLSFMVVFFVLLILYQAIS
jgi:YggT family protein